MFGGDYVVEIYRGGVAKTTFGAGLFGFERLPFFLILLSSYFRSSFYFLFVLLVVLFTVFTLVLFTFFGVFERHKKGFSLLGLWSILAVGSGIFQPYRPTQRTLQRRYGECCNTEIYPWHKLLFQVLSYQTTALTFL